MPQKKPQRITEFDIAPFWRDFDKHSKIKGLLDVKESTTCLYKAKAEHSFWWHSHESSESIIVLGTIIVYLGEEVTFLDGESIIRITNKTTYHMNDVCHIKSDVIHKIDFITDTTLVLSWCPKFENSTWKAVNSEEEEEKISCIYQILEDSVNLLFQ